MSFIDAFAEIGMMENDRIQQFIHHEIEEEMDNDSPEDVHLLRYDQFMEEVGENGLKTLTGISSNQFSEVLDVSRKKEEFIPEDADFNNTCLASHRF